MPAKTTRWAILFATTVLFVGCDSNPGGPAAPTAPSAEGGAASNVPTSPTKPAKTKGARAGNVPQVAD